MGSEVHDGIAARKDSRKFRGISDISDDEFKSSGQFAMAGGEIVINNDIETAAPENVSGMTANIAGTSNN
jgi:hypothetical protein